ncbi:APC family permease [Jongsikchunia kroppenstedtii]|uniref:APC family permease n=1 Tax=Jongsikchunia kroppenstedtii TaxID=1121721 RepID=UPI0003821818|nr:amino acid permease [Jongsikchunia kroppenstedtii]
MSNPLTRTKSVEQSIADTDEPGTRLRKALTWRDLTVFGVSVVIGAGIFSVTASQAGDKAGPSISLAFLMAAVACALAALCYAEFASVVPVAGSAYTFSYATFGELAAWIIGWDLILEMAVGAATVAKNWSLYLGQLFGFSGGVSRVGGHDIDWGALIVIGAVTGVVAIGVKLSSTVSAVITAIKVAVVIFIIVVGAFYIKTGNYSPFIPKSEPGSKGAWADSSLFQLMSGGGTSSYGVYGMLAAASVVFFAFIGFDIVATTAEETKNPQKDVPRGIFASLGIVTVLYVLTTLVVTGMVKYTDLKTHGKDKATLATAFHIVGLGWAEKLISLGALAGLTTVVMVLVIGQIRVLFAMSRDGLLPRQLAKTNRNGTPVRITLIVGLLVAIAATVFPVNRLEEMVNVGTLFAFVLVAAGVWILRVRRPDLKRGFTVPWMPLIPILAIAACLWLMLNLTALTWIRFGVWMAIGMVLYFGYSMRHSVLARRERDPDRAPTPAA